MDDVESIELGEAGLDHEVLGEEATVKVNLSLKTGEKESLSFRIPAWAPIYAEPLTDTSLFNIIASAYSYGEAPFLCLPVDSGGYRFIDLSATNYMDVEVVYD